MEIQVSQNHRSKKIQTQCMLHRDIYNLVLMAISWIYQDFIFRTLFSQAV